MRLLDTETGEFVEKDPRKDTNLNYALSHTWDPEGEQTYQVLRKIQQRYDPKPQPGQSQRREPPRTGLQLSSADPPAIPSPVQPSPNLSIAVTTPVAIPPGNRRQNSPLAPLQLPEVHILKSIWGLLALLLAFVESTSESDPPERSTSDQLETQPPCIWDDPELSPKIREACAVARANGYQYIWIDSCCIDKTSSSELSEAINSMYAWYARADICYGYLADVPPAEDHRKPRSDFRGSLWFTRGWTLQELIAPLNVLFLSGDWAPIAPKYALADLIEEITGISEEALLHVEPLDRFSVAQRLSWAAGRETTRVEDQAYSLLGIFDINMPTLYGEGDRAFRRLQEEIMQRVPDQSLFAWGDVYLGPQIFKSLEPDAVTTTTSEMSQRISYHARFPASPLAMAPRFFADCRTVSASSHDITHNLQLEYTSSPYGIRTQFQLLPLSLLFPPDSLRHHRKQDMEEDWQWYYLAILGCQHAERPGHLLGRVCYIPPSDSGVDFVYPGYVHVSPKSLLHGRIMSSDLFLLPPEIIEHCRPYIQPRTVYISHPDRHDPKAAQANPSQPQHTINLLLLTKTRDALRAQGYAVDFHRPAKSHLTGTHWLTLSHDKHNITVEFQHTLDSNGKRLVINAQVAMSARDVVDSAGQFPQADPSTVSWTDSFPWRARLGQHKGVKLTAGGAEPLILRLRLDLICAEAYLLHIVLLTSSEPPPASSPSPVQRPRGEERGVSGIHSDGCVEHNRNPRVVDAEDGPGREEEADNEREVRSAGAGTKDLQGGENEEEGEDGVST
ncbi:HET-domain-containing protein [Ganoderma leucocontextum]|nr:HET-domain-containing protein [Ganoderma leucocontextum]